MGRKALRTDRVREGFSNMLVFSFFFWWAIDFSSSQCSYTIRNTCLRFALLSFRIFLRFCLFLQATGLHK
jgi:hypothetical protein